MESHTHTHTHTTMESSRNHHHHRDHRDHRDQHLDHNDDDDHSSPSSPPPLSPSLSLSPSLRSERPLSTTSSRRRLRPSAASATKILLCLLFLFPAFNIYVGRRIILFDDVASPLPSSSSSSSSLRRAPNRPTEDEDEEDEDEEVEEDQDDGSARTSFRQTYPYHPLPETIPGTSLTALRFPPRVILPPLDESSSSSSPSSPSSSSSSSLWKKIQSDFPKWDVTRTSSDRTSCRDRWKTIATRDFDFDVDVDFDSSARMTNDMCALAELYVRGGLCYLAKRKDGSDGNDLLRNVTMDTYVLSAVRRDGGRSGMELVWLGAPAGHPLIRRTMEILHTLRTSLGTSKTSTATATAASTIMAMEELYHEQSPLNATSLASKGVLFLSLSSPNATAERTPPPTQPTGPKPPTAPNVTMIRTMLMNGRDDDGNAFPPPTNFSSSCHSHPVAGSDHDYVRALKETAIHALGPLNSTTVRISPWNHYPSHLHHSHHTRDVLEVPAPTLMCLIYSVRESHADKLEAIRNTWAGGCDGFLVFSTATDLRIPAVSIPHRGREEYQNMWQKIRSIWRYVATHHLDEFDWFHMGGDDMFVLPTNLKTYLASLAHVRGGSPRTVPYFVGRRFQEVSQTRFNTGGPGYTLSRAALRKYVDRMDTRQCSPDATTPKEDVMISQCLTSLGVHLTDTRDAKGRERYHHFDPGWMLDYSPQRREVGRPIPRGSDWYEIFNRKWGMLFGPDCCAPDSVSFHYVSPGAIRHMHALLYECDRNRTSSPASAEGQTPPNPYCRWEPVQTLDDIALFRGDASRYRTNCHRIPDEGDSISDSIRATRLEVVVSHCRASNFDWIYYDILLQVPTGWTVNLTFLSRCGAEKSIPDFREYANIEKVDVIDIGDSGGEDRSYAKFIHNFTTHPSPAVILFAKYRSPFSINVKTLGGYRNTTEMIHLASNHEFACGIKPGPKYAWYHDKQTLQDFFLDEWNLPSKAGHPIFNANQYNNLGDFHRRALNYTFPPSKYTPVCYGGSFATHSRKILDFFDRSDGRAVVERLERALSRSGQSIVEEHFAERSWAGFFSEPLSAALESKLESDVKGIVPSSQATGGQIQRLL